MAKDPAFLFYSSDFLSGVSDLTMEERGQYITLLCLQHQKGHLSEKLIKICLGNATADVMQKFSIDKDGLYFSPRLDIEIQKRAEHSIKQRERAIEGWKKRKATADATALPLENEIKNISNTVSKNENFKNECLTQHQWMETIAMNIKIPLDKIHIALTDFNKNLIIDGDEKTNLKDYKNHFARWARRMKELKSA